MVGYAPAKSAGRVDSEDGVMGGQANRKALREQYEQTREAGVYRIVNSGNGKSLLGAALNLASVRNRRW